MLKRIIAITNQKGGVGKTTTSINLAAAFGLAGQKTLLIDIDPQSNCTSGVGIFKEKIKKNIYDVFINQTIDKDMIIKTGYKNLDVIPSQIDLVGIDIELVSMPNREYIFKKALSFIKEKYNFIIIDCPPSLNLLTINALTAADSILIPVQCQYYALEGLTQLLGAVDLVKEDLNKQLEIEGFLLTMFAQNEQLDLQIRDDVKAHFGDKVFQTIIGKDNKLAEAPSFGKPIIYYNPRSNGAKDYLELSKEILEKYGGK